MSGPENVIQNSEAAENKSVQQLEEDGRNRDAAIVSGGRRITRKEDSTF